MGDKEIYKKKKTPGSAKGTKHGGAYALSGVVKEKLAAFITEQIDNLPRLFMQMEPNEKVQALIRLLPYVTPKMSERAVSASINVTVKDEISKLASSDMENLAIPDAQIIEDDVEDDFGDVVVEDREDGPPIAYIPVGDDSDGEDIEREEDEP